MSCPARSAFKNCAGSARISAVDDWMVVVLVMPASLARTAAYPQLARCTPRWPGEAVHAPSLRRPRVLPLPRGGQRIFIKHGARRHVVPGGRIWAASLHEG